MSDVIDRAVDVRDGEDLPKEALAAYLNQILPPSTDSAPELVPELAIKQYPGGHSNLTYLLHYGDQELILRRPPVGSKVATAHDMSREFRVLSALSKSYAKAPTPIAFCEDESLIGSPFYLMERVAGVIIRRKPPKGLDLNHASAAALCGHLVDTLAELHNLDFEAIGLGDLGRPIGYIERQVTGWSARYQKSKTSESASAESIAQWLAERMPTEARAALIHNDFKFDNLVLDPATLEVRGVLDWEMTTLGDPRMDLGTALAYWVEPTDPPSLQALAFGPTTIPGMWTRAKLIERYEERTGVSIGDPLFFYVFGLFKLAVIVTQIYFRFAKGLTSDPRFAALGESARVLFEHAHSCTERSDL